MRMRLFVWIGVLAACFACTAGQAGEWGYSGEFGPDGWYKANPEFAMCSQGKNQSPIDIEPVYDTNLPALEFSYPHKGVSISHTGHSIEVGFAPGNILAAGGMLFELQQVHFHSPSENHVMGKSFPFEAHFVHTTPGGAIAVVAVLFEQGPPNAGIAALWEEMPEKGRTKTLKAAFDPTLILPVERDYMYFNGSLTTPPCSEGVRWYVLKKTLRVSAEQVEKMVKALGGSNNRPLQGVNARVILE